jgi:hypothetical protein
MVLLFILSYPVLGRRVRIEVEEDGTLRYFKGANLKLECDLIKCRVYDTATGSLLTSAKGIGVVLPDKKVVIMDCSLMTLKQFKELNGTVYALSASNSAQGKIDASKL